MNRIPIGLVSILFALSMSTAVVAQPQKNPVIVNSNITLPKSDGEALVSALNKFLDAAQESHDKNKFVLNSQRLETHILLDEVVGVEKSDEFEDDRFYKPYLTNVVSLKDEKFLIQVSFIGTRENRAFLNANFEFIGHKTGDGAFLFSSPLVRNTLDWKTETVGRHHFHCQSEINNKKTQLYERLTSSFDNKLKLKNKSTIFYCCRDVRDALRLIGVEYKADYNGEKSDVFVATIGDRTLTVLGNDNASFGFDPHDLWHQRLSLVIPRSKVNQPIDEGCAHLYGGSWGESWENILKVFEREVVADKEISWLECKHTARPFGEGYPRKFFVDHVINALLVNKIENEKGFEGVWEFLNCGPRERRTEDNYFRVLEKLTGITKATYDAEVWKLVKAEMK